MIKMNEQQLWHVNVTLSSRDENPGARGEERTYCEWGETAKNGRVRWLRERNPGCPIVCRKVSKLERSPIC